MIKIGEGNGRETGKDNKTIFRKERLKKEKTVEVLKTKVDNDMKKLLREVTVKVKLK